MLKPQQTVVNIYFMCEWITFSHSWIITCESYGGRFNFKGREIRFDILGQIMIFCGFLLFLNVKLFLFSWTAPSHNIRTLWQAILFVYPIFSTHHFMLFGLILMIRKYTLLSLLKFYISGLQESSGPSQILGLGVIYYTVWLFIFKKNKTNMSNIQKQNVKTLSRPIRLLWEQRG